jgi:hypothetical protein
MALETNTPFQHPTMNPVAILLLSKIDRRSNPAAVRPEPVEAKSAKSLLTIIFGILNLIAGGKTEKGAQ